MDAWGPYCVYPPRRGPWIHIVYPVGRGIVQEASGEYREATREEMEPFNQATHRSFEKSFVYGGETPLTPRK